MRRGFDITKKNRRPSAQAQGRDDDKAAASAFHSRPTPASGATDLDKADHARTVREGLKLRCENKYTRNKGKGINLELLSKIVQQSKVDETPCVTLHFDHPEFDETVPPTPKRWAMIPLEDLDEILNLLEQTK